MADPEVHARQTAVRARILQRVEEHVPGDTAGRAAAEALAAHVPDGGRVGARCLAPVHPVATAWPCAEFEALEDPDRPVGG